MARRFSQAQRDAQRLFARRAKAGNFKLGKPKKQAARTRAPMAKKTSKKGRAPSRRSNMQHPAVSGLLAGAASRLISQSMPNQPLAAPVAVGVVGHFTGNDALVSVAAANVGSQLASGVRLPGLSAAPATGPSPAGYL